MTCEGGGERKERKENKKRNQALWEGSLPHLWLQKEVEGTSRRAAWEAQRPGGPAARGSARHCFQRP